MLFEGRFAGRTAIISGGAAGIGLAIANRVTAEGGKVAVWDRDGDADDRAVADGHASLGKIVDVGDADSVARAAQETAGQFGTIDILVCSAGITGPNTTLWDYPIADWRRVFDVNLHGVFYCNRAVAPLMVANQYGRIVNIASIAGKEGNPNLSAYSAAKAGVIGLTKSLGKELAKFDIAVNAITPATANTRILETLTPEFIEYMLMRIPRGRFLEIEEAAAMVAWLVSRENSFTTASVFDLSGGRATY